MAIGPPVLLSENDVTFPPERVLRWTRTDADPNRFKFPTNTTPVRKFRIQFMHCVNLNTYQLAVYSNKRGNL